MKYILTPLGKRIEQVKRVVWRGEALGAGVSEISIPYSNHTELKAYLKGLQDAKDLVQYSKTV